MKKNLFLIFVAVAFIGSLNISSAIQARAAESSMEPQVGTATYIATDKAPIIDGVKDYNWTDSQIYAGSLNCKVAASVDIMWNETGLYYFIEVEDRTFTFSDICNIWVSETFYSEQTDMEYSTTDGAYYLCLNTKGENVHYQAGSGEYQDMTGKYQARVGYSSNGYTVEIYVPVYGNKPLLANGSIGFDVSIDDYLEEGGERSSYENWNGRGPYWNNPSALGKVILLPNPTAEDSVSSGVSIGETSTTSCGAITFAPFVVLAGMAFVFLKKKS